MSGMSARAPVSAGGGARWWPPCHGYKGMFKAGRLPRAGEGAAQEEAEAGQRQGKHSGHSRRQLPALVGSRQSPPGKPRGPQPSPGSTRGTGGREQPGPALTMMPPLPHDPPVPALPQLRTPGRPRRRRLIPGAAPALRGGPPRPTQLRALPQICVHCSYLHRFAWMGLCCLAGCTGGDSRSSIP